MRFALIALVMAAALVQAGGRAGASVMDATRGAITGSGDSHHRLAVDSVWVRRRTIHELEERVRRAPRDAAELDALGAAYYDARFLHSAGIMFERALVLDSADADAHFGLGRTFEREWLDVPARSTLSSAREQFEAAVRARPEFAEAWIALAAVCYERRDATAAREAALRALAIAPQSIEAQLAAAYLAYRAGRVAAADSLFAIVIPRCPRGIGERFSDITPLLSEAEQVDWIELRPAARAEYVRRFWSRSDPDPTTPENEARLEFWSRLAHALLLIGDPWSPHWLSRTDLYTRYGQIVQVAAEENTDEEQTEMSHVAFGEVAADPRPEELAHLHENLIGSGVAVFAPLPPGTRELALASLVSRYQGPHGARLAVRIETPGTPADVRFADCVVLDAGEHEVARDAAQLSPAGCDPAGLRAGEFTFDLPAGRYRVAIAVRDTLGARGVAHASSVVEGESTALAMSDVVLACGTSMADNAQGPVTLHPNLSARVEGAQDLYAYFEVYHLHQDAAGGNHFEYEYTVHDAAGTRSHRGRTAVAPPRLSFRSTQDGVGPLRRQYIRVPTAALPPGRYRLTIAVRDELAGNTTEQSAEFVKAAVEQ